MMKNITSYCLSIIALLLCSTLLPSCDKDKPTVLTGKIRDKVTGLPIEKAQFSVYIVEYGDDGATSSYEEFTLTDKEGNFIFSFQETDKKRMGICCVSKAGYRPKHSFADSETGDNQYDILLTPLDGTLKITFLNQKGLITNLDLVAFNELYVDKPFFDGTLFPKKIPIRLSTAQSFVDTIKMPAGVFTHLYWGESWLGSYMSAPYKDSVFIKRNEVTEYLLAY